MALDTSGILRFATFQVDLRAGEDAEVERTVQLPDLLADPRRQFPEMGGGNA